MKNWLRKVIQIKKHIKNPIANFLSKGDNLDNLISLDTRISPPQRIIKKSRLNIYCLYFMFIFN